MAKNWAHAFLNGLELVDWGLLGELITDQDPKFFSKFWIALFEKLHVKLLYSIAYYLQTNNSSKKTNQTVEIALRFFFYSLQDSAYWAQVFLQI